MPAELIVLSHLRWDWVWQRPQQIISRIAATHDVQVWFVEEPVGIDPSDTAGGMLTVSEVDGVRRAWLQIPDRGHHVGFSDDVIPQYSQQLQELLGEAQGERVVWLYTPLALDVAMALNPTTLVYDVMDDLAAFRGAAPELVLRQRQALREADIVIAGGRSLHQSVAAQGRTDALLVPSGVSAAHYASAVRDDAHMPARPVAGYVGVIDERLDLNLIAQLAVALPEWTIRMIGPLAKVDASDLPTAPNIEYLGKQEYSALPGLMAQLDVALMPFALNEATRSISPTKTLEYLAAGLPVVSTRIEDVVMDFGEVVDLADDAVGFAVACRRHADRTVVDQEKVARVIAANDWDGIAERLSATVFARHGRNETLPEVRTVRS
jgi:glycosyltransferase involved in cell wall biosynthesis